MVRTMVSRVVVGLLRNSLVSRPNVLLPTLSLTSLGYAGLSKHNV